VRMNGPECVRLITSSTPFVHIVMNAGLQKASRLARRAGAVRGGRTSPPRTTDTESPRPPQPGDTSGDVDRVEHRRRLQPRNAPRVPPIRRDRPRLADRARRASLPWLATRISWHTRMMNASSERSTACAERFSHSDAHSSTAPETSKTSNEVQDPTHPPNAFFELHRPCFPEVPARRLPSNAPNPKY
jgi:hypothetical protein